MNAYYSIGGAKPTAAFVVHKPSQTVDRDLSQNVGTGNVSDYMKGRYSSDEYAQKYYAKLGRPDVIQTKRRRTAAQMRR